MNKKGIEVLMQNLVFILIAILFFSILLFFVSRQGSNAGAVEEVNAKKIALAIDAAVPGTEITLNIEDVVKEAEKNEFTGRVIVIDNDLRVVRVQVKENTGNSYGFFNDVDVGYKIEGDNIVLEIGGSGE